MPSLLQQLTQADSTALLAGVVERNFPICLELKRGDVWVLRKSRFLGVASSDQADSPGLWIEAATADDKAGDSLDIDQTLLASFALGQSCYRFMSKVIRVGQCELASGQSVAGAVVEWPDGVEKIERRQYFRCNISPNQPVEAALWPGGKTRRPTSPNGNRRVYRGRMVNASLGGVLIRLTRPDDPGLAFGDTIGLEFTLEPGSPLILLDANIRRYTKHHNGMIDVGVKFVGLDFSVIGRKTLTHLSQALARIERHNLRWRKFDVG